MFSVKVSTSSFPTIAYVWMVHTWHDRSCLSEWRDTTSCNKGMKIVDPESTDRVSITKLCYMELATQKWFSMSCIKINEELQTKEV